MPSTELVTGLVSGTGVGALVGGVIQFFRAHREERRADRREPMEADSIQVSTAKESLFIQQGTLNDLRKENQRIASENAALRAEITHLRDVVDQIQARLEATKAELGSCQAALNELREQISAPPR